MNFLSKLLQGIAFVPAIVHGVEGLFGHKSGIDKKNVALELAQSTIQAADAISGKDIVDPGKFQEGLGKGHRRSSGVPELVGVVEDEGVKERGFPQTRV